MCKYIYTQIFHLLLHVEPTSKVMYIEAHDSNTHCWSSSTLLRYLDFLAIELRKKRMELNVDASARALIICDKAAVHHAATYSRARELWQTQHNALILHGTSSDLIRIPGGFGATGGPNDSWHQYFHGLRRSWLKVACGFGSFPKLRKSMEDIQLSIDGNSRFSSGNQEFRLILGRKNMKNEKHIYICIYIKQFM